MVALSQDPRDGSKASGHGHLIACYPYLHLIFGPSLINFSSNHLQNPQDLVQSLRMVAGDVMHMEGEEESQKAQLLFLSMQDPVACVFEFWR